MTGRLLIWLNATPAKKSRFAVYATPKVHTQPPMLTAESALALFVMLAISSLALFVAQRLRIPHTVLLVAIGIVLGFLSLLPYMGFLAEFSLTPELLFFIFLPILIFDCAYNINIRHLTHDALIITVLAVGSLLVSAFLIAFGLDFVFSLIGLDIPFILSLVFGAIISATDPVAVLALFKEYGAPRRLSLIFEGESIFNDATAVALFLVVLAVAENGGNGVAEVFQGALTFSTMLIGGIVFGLVFGGIFVKLVGYTRASEFASITLTMVMAHTTFICAELITHHVTIAGAPVPISSIIATTTSSLLMGNYGRYKISPLASGFVERYWSHFAFLSNSLIFLMIGMFVTRLPISTPGLLIPIIICILIVAGARAVSIYPIVNLFNVFSRAENRVPRAWQHVLAWGSLRGALAVTMVLMIPESLAFSDWDLALTPKELVLTLTVSCIFATLFIKATTITGFMRRLKLNVFTPAEEINQREILVYVYAASINKLKEGYADGSLDLKTYRKLLEAKQGSLQNTLADLRNGMMDQQMIEKVVRLHAIGIERKYLKALNATGETPESVMKLIVAKLDYQSQAIEYDLYDEVAYEHGHPQDIFERLAALIRAVFGRTPTAAETTTQNYLYYRGLLILSRKVVAELADLKTCFSAEFQVLYSAIDRISALYEKYRGDALRYMGEIRAAHPEMVAELDIRLGYRTLYQQEAALLENLREREMVTPKVSIALANRLEIEDLRRR
jgi:CPA1 family monovalent cation:H+ antiporter